MKKLSAKSRWMLYLSIFISGLVIFTAVFYFIAAQKSQSSGLDNIILIIIIILAVLAVLFMLLTRLKLRKRTSALSPEYFEMYEEISDKLNGTSMSMMEKKETLSDILDLFLLAQKDGRSAEDVTGKNIDDFVTQIQDSFGYRSRFLHNIFVGVQYSVLYLFLMQGFEYFSQSDAGFFNQEISISTSMLLLPIAFVGAPMMTGLIRKNKPALAMLIPIAIFILYIGLMETINAFFLDIPWVYTFAEGKVNAIPNVWMLVLWIGLFVLAALFKWIQRKTSVKKL
ncbi:MAG: DUF1048 domain-containing protein [Clostridia bacterium]|nr:DUF1048 domain-containing protein [Clostridia bacterium]